MFFFNLSVCFYIERQGGGRRVGTLLLLTPPRCFLSSPFCVFKIPSLPHSRASIPLSLPEPLSDSCPLLPPPPFLPATSFLSLASLLPSTPLYLLLPAPSPLPSSLPEVNIAPWKFQTFWKHFSEIVLNIVSTTSYSDILIDVHISVCHSYICLFSVSRLQFLNVFI